MTKLAKKTIREISDLIKTKQISPVEITEDTLKQIDSYNEKINAYIKISADEARLAAKKAEEEISHGNYRGTLHGIPMALKDIFYFKDEIVTIGSKIHGEFVPSFDGTVISKLKEAGAIFTGKLNLHEYAWGATTNNPHYGACRNPWNVDNVPGGSSGGSGAAVAGDMTIASLGTDTGGSIRIPAALCGIVGLKPTYGRVSKHGCFPLCWTLDHIGPMTKTVEDAAILLEYIAGYDINDSTSINTPVETYTEHVSAGVKNIVIGIEEDYFFKNIDSEVNRLVRKAISSLEEMGAKVEIISIPSMNKLLYAQSITMLTEASAVHHQNLRLRPQDFGEDVRMVLELGEIPSAVDYLEAQELRTQFQLEFKKVFEKIDVLISPTLPFVSSRIDSGHVIINGREEKFSENVSRLTRPGNFLGYPAISIPCGLSNGLPVGMQIMGAPFKESTILRVAGALEKTNPLMGLRPNL